MKKIIILGCPGSGKTTFAKKLNQITGLPLYHLDAIWHLPDKTHIAREDFDKRLFEIFHTPEWIIDGNFDRTIPHRLQYCDTVFFLDESTETCLAGVRARRGQPRSDLPWIENSEDPEFEQFIRDFSVESRPRILKLLAQYSDKSVYLFQSRKEAEAFLRHAEKQT